LPEKATHNARLKCNAVMSPTCIIYEVYPHLLFLGEREGDIQKKVKGTVFLVYVRRVKVVDWNHLRC